MESLHQRRVPDARAPGSALLTVGGGQPAPRSSAATPPRPPASRSYVGEVSMQIDDVEPAIDADIGDRRKRVRRSSACRSDRGISDRPRIHHGYSESLEVTEVARGKRCLPSRSDAGDLDVPDLD